MLNLWGGLSYFERWDTFPLAYGERLAWDDRWC
jgi:hypothetical protein